MKRVIVGFVLTVLAVTWGIAQDQAEIPLVTKDDIAAWKDSGKSLVILDIRDSDENSIGTIPGSIRIPYFIAGQGISETFVDDVKQVFKPESQTILVCGSGRVSMRAYGMLEKSGLDVSNVAVFKHGLYGDRATRDSNEYLSGWLAVGLPFEKGDRMISEYSTDEGITIVDADTVRGWLDAGESFVIIDVRTPRELVQYGKPVGSINIPLSVPDPQTAGRWMNNPDLVSEVEKAAGGKDGKVLTICTLSWRAGMAAKELQDAGFTDVQAFHHGIQGRITGYEMTKGWRALGLPYELPEKE